MTFFNGDQIEYTGKTLILHGGEWREFRYLDGRKKGQIGVSPTEAQIAKNRAEKNPKLAK